MPTANAICDVSSYIVLQPLQVCHAMLSLCGKRTPSYPWVLNKFVNKRDMAVCFIKSALHSGNKSDNTLNGGCGSQNILSWSNTARYLLYFSSCPLRDVLKILEEE